MASAGLLISSIATMGGPPVAVAGGGELIMASGGGGRLGLTRGSELGTICYEVIASRDSMFGPEPILQLSGWSMTVRTQPMIPSAPELPPLGSEVMDVTLMFDEFDEVVTGCVNGIDQSVVTDVFANPGNYHYWISVCWDFIGCSARSDPLSPGASGCELVPEATHVVATHPFVVRGAGLLPGTTAQLTFTPLFLFWANDQSGTAGSMAAAVDLYGNFVVELAARNEQAGQWRVTVAGEGGCSGGAELSVAALARGTPFPDGLTPMPGIGAVFAGAGGPAEVPDTAMPSG